MIHEESDGLQLCDHRVSNTENVDEALLKRPCVDIANVAHDDHKSEDADSRFPLVEVQPDADGGTWYSIEEGVCATGFGVYQLRMAVVTGCGWFADLLELGIISVLLPILHEEWGLTEGEKGLLGSSVYLGMMIGALICGISADKIGRKPVFMMSLLVASVAGFLSALSMNYTFLLATRFFVGAGVGGNLPVSFTLFTECVPTADRGRYMACLSFCAPFGLLMVGVIQIAVIPRIGWHWTLAVLSLPAFLSYLVGFVWVHESPRFLLLSGQKSKAVENLEFAFRTNHKDGSPFPFKGRQLRSLAPAAHVRSWDLLDPKYLRNTLLLWIVWFFLEASAASAGVWLATILRSKGLDEDQMNRVFVWAMVGAFPGLGIVMLVIDKTGRVLVLATALMGAGAMCIASIYSSSESSLTATMFFRLAFDQSAWASLYTLTPECYPTSLRAAGLGTAT